MEKVKERSSSIELLRIIAIFIIIVNHYALYSGFVISDKMELSTIIPQWLHIGGKLGVNIFIFISGYFLCESKKFRLIRLVKIVLEVFFYSIFIIIFAKMVTNTNTMSIIRIIFAIPSSYWRFITLYFMLYILSPYINLFLNTVDMKKLLTLIITLTITWVVIPTFCYFGFDIDYSIAWFIYVYILAAFLKRIEKNIPNNPKKYILIGIASIVLIGLSEVLIRYIGVNYINKLINGVEHFRNYNSLFVIIATVFLFIGFKQIEMKNNKIINKIASTSLAVFILHDNGLYSNYVWKNILRSASFQYSKLLIFHALGSCLLLFVCFAIIDLLRQRFIENPVMKFLTPRIENLQQKISNQLDNYARKLC